MSNYLKYSWIVLFSMVLFSVLMAQNPIPNPGFEDWIAGTPSNPVGWLANNIAQPYTVLQSSDAHSGSYSVQLVTNPLQGGSIASAFPVSERYENFSGYYKLSTTTGQFVNVQIIMLKSDNQIASVDHQISATAASWTAFSVPITYTGSGDPDSCQIIISLGGFPAAGSSALLDDLAQVAYVVPNFSECKFGYPFGANEIHLKQRDRILTHLDHNKNLINSLLFSKNRVGDYIRNLG